MMQSMKPRASMATTSQNNDDSIRNTYHFVLGEKCHPVISSSR